MLRSVLYQTDWKVESRDEWRKEARQRFRWFLERGDFGTAELWTGLFTSAQQFGLHDIVLELADHKIASKRKPTAEDFELRLNAQIALRRFADADDTLSIMASHRRPPANLPELRTRLEDALLSWQAERIAGQR